MVIVVAVQTVKGHGLRTEHHRGYGGLVGEADFESISVTRGDGEGGHEYVVVVLRGGRGVHSLGDGHAGHPEGEGETGGEGAREGRVRGKDEMGRIGGQCVDAENRCGCIRDGEGLSVGVAERGRAKGELGGERETEACGEFSPRRGG